MSSSKVIKALKKRGIKVYGNDVLVGEEAQIDCGATIYSPCAVLGKSHICKGAKLFPNCYLNGAYVGADTCVYASVISDTHVGKGCIIGPYANLRAGARIGEGCRIGDFVEIKSSAVGAGSKVAHLSYVGDAVIGKNVNVGCGVVFANFDGKHKRETVVEDACFIGCNCNVIAPSKIGAGAYIAAATTVCGEVGAGSLCVGRCRPKIVEGGAAGRYLNG